MDIDIRVVVTSNQLFIRDLALKQNFQKKVITDKTPFFLDVHFVLPILFALTVASGKAVFG